MISSDYLFILLLMKRKNNKYLFRCYFSDSFGGILLVKASPYISDRIILNDTLRSFNNYILTLQNKGFFTINDFLGLESFRLECYGTKLLSKLQTYNNLRKSLENNLKKNKNTLNTYLCVFQGFSSEERDFKDSLALFTPQRLNQLLKKTDIPLITINKVITIFRVTNDYILKKGIFLNLNRRFQ